MVDEKRRCGGNKFQATRAAMEKHDNRSIMCVLGFRFSSVQFSSVTEFMFHAAYSYNKNYDGCADA